MAFDKWKGLRVGNEGSFQRLAQILARDSGEEALITNFINSIAYKSQLSLVKASDIDAENYDGLANNLLVVDPTEKFITFTDFPYAAAFCFTLASSQVVDADGAASPVTLQLTSSVYDTHGFAYGNGAKIPPGMEGYYHIGIAWEFYTYDPDLTAIQPNDFDAFLIFHKLRLNDSTNPVFFEALLGNSDEMYSNNDFGDESPFASSVSTLEYLKAGDELTFDSCCDIHVPPDNGAGQQWDLEYYTPNTRLWGFMVGKAIPGEEP